jgi:hypothetical protein
LSCLPDAGQGYDFMGASLSVPGMPPGDGGVRDKAHWTQEQYRPGVRDMALCMWFWIVDDATIQRLREAPHLLTGFLEDNEPVVAGPNHRNADTFHFKWVSLSLTWLMIAVCHQAQGWTRSPHGALFFRASTIFGDRYSGKLATEVTEGDTHFISF